MLERLHKVLARAGVAALRPAEDMIMAGRVTVNGRVVRELGARVDAEADVIAVDGELVEIRQPTDPHRYVILHKPVGVISTAQDTHDRPTVVGLVPSDRRLFPVGRLDADSEGLILLTDDGDLAYRLTHPRFEVEKEYRVLLDRAPSVEDLRAWREGVELEGEMTMPAWVEVLERTPAGVWIRVVMREGRNRQIRAIARMLGYEVLRLIRVREGPITLNDLPAGQWRDLTPAEIQMLRAHTQHIPSRAADEEAERRMADRNRPEGRRLRVIRGLRRPAFNEQAPGMDQQLPDAETQPTGAAPQPMTEDDSFEFTAPDATSSRPSRTDRPPTEQRPNNYGERRGPSTGPGQRQPQRDFDRSGGPARRPNFDEGRSREGGRNDRPGGGYNNRGPNDRAGGGYNNRGPNDRAGGGYNNRGPNDRAGGGYNNRGPNDRAGGGYNNRGPNDRAGGGYNNRGPNDRAGGGYNNRGPNDRAGGGYSGPRRDAGTGNRGFGERSNRPGDNRQGYGDRSNRYSSGGQRGQGYGNPGDYRDRRDYQHRSDEPRSNDRGPRDYGNQARRPTGPSGERRGFGGPPRDRGPRSADDRRGFGGPPRDRGPRSADDRRGFGGPPRDRGPRSADDRRGFGGPDRERPPRNMDDLRRNAFDEERGPGSGPDREEWDRPQRPPAQPGNRAGAPRSDRREGGFGSRREGGYSGASRGGGSGRPGGRPGSGPSRPGSRPGRSGPGRPGGGNRPQGPARGPRKGRNNH